jgi:hypothetical protein
MTEYADADDEAVLQAATPETTGHPDLCSFLDSDDAPRMRALVDAILQDSPPVEGRDYTAFAEDNDGRTIAFWLMRVLCLGQDDHEG